jgi:hypothetical protein
MKTITLSTARRLPMNVISPGMCMYLGRMQDCIRILYSIEVVEAQGVLQDKYQHGVQTKCEYRQIAAVRETACVKRMCTSKLKTRKLKVEVRNRH